MKPASLYDEKAADKEVISSLLRHIKKITKEKNMPLFKDENGQVNRVVDSNPVSREELVATFEKAQQELNEFDALNSVPEVAPEAPVEQPVPEAPAPVEPTVIENQVQPIEQPVEVAPEAVEPVAPEAQVEESATVSIQ